MSTSFGEMVHPKQQWAGRAAENGRQPTSRYPIPRDLALLLSASVQKYPSDMMVTSGPSTTRCGPWLLDRAMRDVRGRVEGLPDGFSFHDLRHFLASLLIASGADIKTVQARLRHASATTTLDTSGHLWPDADESTRNADRRGARGAHEGFSCVPTAYRGAVLTGTPQVSVIALACGSSCRGTPVG